MSQQDGYLDILWSQFRKNGAAYIALWLLAPLFLAAIFAPVLASNVPFYYSDGKETLWPWFRALWNPEETVDFWFNTALAAFFPWIALAAILNGVWRRRNVGRWARRGRIAVLYVGLIGIISAVLFIPGVRPDNRYRARTFPEEQFRKGAGAIAIYPLIPFGPTEQDIESSVKPPLYRKPRFVIDSAGRETLNWRKSNDGFPHILGTDDVGRDVLVRMIYGLRISLTVGFVAVGLYITIGVVLGAIAGYFGGAVDIVISRIIEVIILFPSFFLILTLVGLLGQSIYIIMVVIGLTGWPTVARLIRGEVLKQRAIDYVQAARALGASHARIIFRHILPNAVSPALVAAPFGIAGAIITEAGLSLLGFGVRLPAPSWGLILRTGSENYHYWWLVVFPSLAIFFTVTVFNLVGSGLRDAMDPRLRL
ncbi:MAG: ABC transporter permease [Thermogutta sp.]|nr:ABC transporter permease [Thermogutta sp.]